MRMTFEVREQLIGSIAGHAARDVHVHARSGVTSHRSHFGGVAEQKVGLRERYDRGRRCPTQARVRARADGRSAHLPATASRRPRRCSPRPLVLRPSRPVRTRERRGTRQDRLDDGQLVPLRHRECHPVTHGHPVSRFSGRPYQVGCGFRTDLPSRGEHERHAAIDT